MVGLGDSPQANSGFPSTQNLCGYFTGRLTAGEDPDSGLHAGRRCALEGLPYTRGTGTLILAELLQEDPEAPGSEGSLVVSVKQQPGNQHTIRGFVAIIKSVLQTLHFDCL